MKILTKKEFLKLPPGVFFCKGKPWHFLEIEINGESLEESSDFYSHNLCVIDAFDSGELSDRFEDCLKNGTSYPINKSESRDGCFEDDDLFLVYEKEDLQFITERIKEALEVLK